LNIQNVEKCGVFLGSAAADVEIRAMAIVVPLHPAQGKGVHPNEFLPEYCRGAWGRPKILKIYLSVMSATSSKRCRQKTIRPPTFVVRNYFADGEIYQREKFGLQKV
jgi:hypothetical protein